MSNPFSTLTSSEETETPSVSSDNSSFFGDTPSYMRGAQIHSVSSGDISFLESAKHAVVSSIMSGANSFYNTGVAVGNILGGDFEERSTYSWIQEYDDDTAKWYRDNQSGADMAGFIVGSFIPGLGATKLYNAGMGALKMAEAGVVGANMSEATGLLVPKMSRYLQVAKAELVSPTSPSKWANTNFQKAIIAGGFEQGIQGAIQTAAVFGTMYKSPILDGMDVEDIGWNIALGGVLGGVIGGALNSAKLAGSVNKFHKAVDAELKPYIHIEAVMPGTEGADSAINGLHVLDQIKLAPVPADLTVEGISIAGEAEGRMKGTISRIKDLVRTEVRSLSSKGDDVVGNSFTDLVLGTKEFKDQLGTLDGARELSRLSVKSTLETQMEAAGRRVALGKELPGDVALLGNHVTKYVKLWGEGAGSTFDSKPVQFTLADTLKPGEEIVITREGVKVGSRNLIKFNTNPKKPWSVFEASVEEAEARHMWVESLEPLPAGITIHADDIPLLGKAVRENTPGLKVILPEQGGEVTFRDQAHLQQFYKDHVDLTAQRLRDAVDNNKIVPASMVERKLKELTGIPFKVSHKPGESWSGRTFEQGHSATYSPIEMNSAYFNRPLIDILSTLKHEEGHTLFNTLVDIGLTPRHGGGQDIIDELIATSKKQRGWAWNDSSQKMQSYLNDKHELMADAFAFFSKNPAALKDSPLFAKEFGHLIRPLPQSVLDSVILKARQLDNPQISRALNIKLGRLEKTAIDHSDEMGDYSAIQTAHADHVKFLKDSGVITNSDKLKPVYTQPQFAKVIYNTSKTTDLDGNVLDGIAGLKERQRLAQMAAENVTANFFRELDGYFIPASELNTRNAIASAGETQSKFTTANGAYGSEGSKTQYMGVGTAKVTQREHNATHASLDSALHEMRMDTAASLEYSALETMARSSPEIYYHDIGNSRLVLRSQLNYENSLEIYKEALRAGKQGLKEPTAPVRDANIKVEIPITSDKVNKVIAAHISRNGERLTHDKAFKSIAGLRDNKDPLGFYPPPADPTKYPHFAFVVDDSVTGTGHVSMIYAATPNELEGLIQSVRRSNPEFNVITKDGSESYHKAFGDYVRDETLSENYINSAIFRKGTSANFIPKTDPAEIAQSLLDWHLQKDAQLARFAVVTRYGKEFNELRSMGKQFTELATSKMNTLSFSKHAESAVKNPYNDLIKQALNITSTNEMPIWSAVNNFADKAWSGIWAGVSGVLSKSTGKLEDLDQINKIFAEKGVKTAYYDAQTKLLSNHTAPAGALNSFVARANGIMASTILHLDPMNAINNTFGSPILTHTELNSLVKGIRAGNSDVAGKLAYIKLPGTGDDILSPVKLHANAIKAFFDPKNREWAKVNGFSTRHIEQLHSVLDDLALTGTESVDALNSKITSAYNKFMTFAEKGGKLTGNALAEEFNRATSALMMKQITDEAVTQGLISDKMALTYINTFVNRTQGNYIASQRPLMFQGALGQAIGLFQTYQFNFAQQMLRHVAEGDSKTAALALGLQGTIYGMNGLPGFQAINQHIIGTMSGNKNHTDLYDATYRVAGKEAGDYLMYGLPSNIGGLLHPDLKFNLYTRGDINPRNPTIVPLDPTAIPLVSASAKLFSSMRETYTKIQDGGNIWPSLLQGIEHSGVNRPLAGLAQTLEALGNSNLQSYSTTNAGNLIASNDLLSIANAVRITGARPLHEALVADAVHRFQVYDAQDSAKRKALGEGIKTTLMLGDSPSEEQMTKFAGEYVKSGGKQNGFNKFYMNLYKTANTAQANVILDNLKSPHSESMQKLMGGMRFNDVSNLD